MIKVRARRFGFVVLAPLALVIVALLPGSAAAGSGGRADVHPAVDVYAEVFPGQLIPVIVQSDDPDLPHWVRQHGGSVGREFDIVDGFQAEMPPDAVRLLDLSDRADWISLDAPLIASHKDTDGAPHGADLATDYPFVAGAVTAWDAGVTGDGVTVAVIDSGVERGSDFSGRLTGSRNFSGEKSAKDDYGHGTWVAGIIAGDDKKDRYVGIAPEADILSVKVAGRDGSARVSDVIDALQWVVDEKDRFNVRVINISLNSAVADSYRRDPLSAAVEEAWFQGIVVVTSAGNLGAGPFAVDHAPANDPFVITVGASDGHGTPDRADDALAGWSSRGVTVDGYAKPEVAAPGVDIVSTSAGKKSHLAQEFGDSVVDRDYIRLTGTSASAAIVSGTVALMLEQDPSLTPDEVKFRVVAAGSPLDGSQAPAVDAFQAVFGAADGAANGDASPNELIDPETGMIMEDSILWRSILWRSILWRSILWRR